MYRRFLIAIAVLIPLSFECRADERPANIIYIMLDDAGYNDFGAMGSDDVHTPNFDRMCREGIRFTDHYSGSAVCAPTRCVLMTGLHTGHCRRRNNAASASVDQADEGKLVFLKDEDVTVAESLQAAGYVTGGIGKWGLGNPGSAGTPDKQGFDHFLGYLDQVHAHDHYTDWLWNDGERMETGKRYSHTLFEEDSLRFIEENREKPFFLYLPYCLPHGKYVIDHDEPAYQLYKDKPWSQTVKNYAAMITRADETVGKILDRLVELGIDDDTLVFYTSDNGPNQPFAKSIQSNSPFQGIKRELNEGGIRAAMAVRWPGHVPVGMTSDFIWDMRDVFPTLCDVANAETPSNLDGISVLPTLLGKHQQPHDHLYWEFSAGSQQAVRMGNWKGIRNGTHGAVRLFDLANDPSESNDLASSNAEVASRIARIMDASHVPSPFWPLQEKVSPKKNRKKQPAKNVSEN
ncbi:arylsulfatase [Rhodopirellula sp. SWK7]|uniref:arylsulfatase n=1 Tax=Rhodopirellula sp. SWK7 TaxID=595460 RepID=UPI0002BE326C|nr:arylsulfatase [Rhodopirellula sp. SWK7]EMI46891.1 N-acetylgalactosamine 6-sulfate sulfatase (GALNS) [Rhodopirellula sp. SWK7]